MAATCSTGWCGGCTRPWRTGCWPGRKEIVNLLNVAGAHDETPPLRNLTVRAAATRNPKAITRLPENQPLPFARNAGEAVVTVAELRPHDASRLE